MPLDINTLQRAIDKLEPLEGEELYPQSLVVELKEFQKKPPVESSNAQDRESAKPLILKLNKHADSMGGGPLQEALNEAVLGMIIRINPSAKTSLIKLEEFSDADMPYLLGTSSVEIFDIREVVPGYNSIITGKIDFFDGEVLRHPFFAEINLTLEDSSHIKSFFLRDNIQPHVSQVDNSKAVKKAEDEKLRQTRDLVESLSSAGDFSSQYGLGVKNRVSSAVQDEQAQLLAMSSEEQKSRYSQDIEEAVFQSLHDEVKKNPVPYNNANSSSSSYSSMFFDSKDHRSTVGLFEDFGSYPYPGDDFDTKPSSSSRDQASTSITKDNKQNSQGVPPSWVDLPNITSLLQEAINFNGVKFDEEKGQKWAFDPTVCQIRQMFVTWGNAGLYRIESELRDTPEIIAKIKSGQLSLGSFVGADADMAIAIIRSIQDASNNSSPDNKPIAIISPDTATFFNSKTKKMLLCFAALTPPVAALGGLIGAYTAAAVDDSDGVTSINNFLLDNYPLISILAASYIAFLAISYAIHKAVGPGVSEVKNDIRTLTNARN